MGKWIVMGLVLMLTGCAPSTVIELREQSTPVAFASEKPYQRLFKDLNAEMHRCIFGGAMMATTIIDSQLYPDLGEGEIAVRYNNMGDKSVFLYIEILDQQNETQVTAYPTTFGRWDDAGERVKEFVLEDIPYCSQS